jgi:acetyl-CoA acetyltransferase
MPAARSVTGAAAVVGVGESAYYRAGQSPDDEFVLTVRAILAACDDAGLDPTLLDGFVSFSDDRNDPSRLACALGCAELRWSTMQWGGGGGGTSGAVQQAAAAVACGFAELVVVHRGLAQGQFGRFGRHRPTNARRDDPYLLPYGVLAPVHWCAPRAMRFFHDTGIDPSVQRAVAMASYHHAQSNPRAVMYGRPLTEDAYDASRWISEPFRLFDCCMENDGAAAMILTTAERARDLARPPAYVLGAAQGAGYREGALAWTGPEVGTANFRNVARHLWDSAGVGPADVDVAQSYENFTGGVVMSLLEHGFYEVEEAEEFLRLENLLAPGGRLPLNTSGGNLAECYVHGLELHLEAVRQLRGESVNQVPGAAVSFVSSGPFVAPASSVLFGTGEVLG